MKLKDLFENKEYTFADWAKDKGIDLNSRSFDCTNTDITSLQGAPTSVGGYFDCHKTKITSLEGAPTSVGGSFDCRNTKITSLKGAPTSVGGFFDCTITDITSLQGAPTSIGDAFDCSNTNITSLEGAPTSIGSWFDCRNTKITSLENVHHYIHHIGGTFYLAKSPTKSNVLGVLWIGCDEQGRPRPDGKAPTSIVLENSQVGDILNTYLAKIHRKEMSPREALLQAQNELQDAGLDEYADL